MFGVHGHDRTHVGTGLTVVVGDLDAVADRLLRHLLQPVVDRQPQRVARLRRLLQIGLSDRAAGGVVVLLEHAVKAAQVGVVGVLDAGLADHVARLLVGELLHLQLGRVDLAGVAEHVGGEVVERVPALRRLQELHAGEAASPLEHVGDLRLGGGLDLHGSAGVDHETGRALGRGAAAASVRLHVQRLLVGVPDVMALDVEHAAEPRQRQAAGLVRQRLAARHRPRRRRRHLLVAKRLRVQRERGAVDPGGQPGRVHLGQDVAGVLDQHRARAILDGAARRRQRQLPHVVLVGLRHVVVGVQHLQRPQPEHQHPEQHRRQHAQRRGPQQQLVLVGRRLLPRRRRLKVHRSSVGRGAAAVAAAAAAAPSRRSG